MNCGYGKGYSVLEIVKIFEKITKKKIYIKYLNRRKGDVPAIINNNKNFIKYFKFGNKNKFNTIERIVEATLNWRIKFMNNSKNS